MPNYLKEREENAAGNTEDSFNPGDQAYNQDMDARFNALKRAEEDREFDDIIAANYGEERPDETKVDSHGDKIRRNFNADDPSENIDKAKNAEESGGPKSMYNSSGGGGKLAGVFRGMGGKKMGPTGGIIGLILFSMLGLGGGMGGLGASLLINIKEMFHNDRSDGTRTNRIFSRAFLANKMNNKDSCTGSKIKCKISTMTKSQIQKYKDAGFDIKGTEIGADGKPTNRTVDTKDQGGNGTNNQTGAKNGELADGARLQVTDVTFPSDDNGKTRKTVQSGKEFFATADKSPTLLRASERSFASKASFYTNKFFSKVLGGKWKFSKAKKAFPSDSDKKDEKDPNKKTDGKKAQDDAFNSQTDGLSNTDKADGSPKLKSEVDKSATEAEKQSGKGKGAKSSALLTAVQMLCTTYKLARGAVTAVKIYQIAQLGKFALIFLQAADEIKDGRGDQSKITYLSNNLTSYEADKTMTKDTNYAKKGEPNPKYNLSATDSQGYKIAAQGDKGGLSKFAQNYILGGNGTVKELDNVLKNVDGAASHVPVPGGSSRNKIKTMCRIVGNKITGAVAACAGVTTALETFGSVAPGIGNLIMGGVSAGLCACTAAGAIPILDKISNAHILGAPVTGCAAMNDLIAEVKDKAIELLKEGPVKEYLTRVLKEVSVGSDTKGVDAGNAIAAGVGLVLSATASGYGLKPSSTDGKHQDITNYISYTQPLEDTYIALDKADARDNPLDATNQYSLMGNLVRSLNIDPGAPMSLFGNLSAFTSILPTALTSAVTGQSASALYNQPSQAANGASGRFDQCKDDDLESINATGDTFCSIVAVTPVGELQGATNQLNNPTNQYFDQVTDWMSAKQPETKDNTTASGESCANIDGSEDENCKNSEQASIDKDTGKPIDNSQYAKYLRYCTDERTDPWGAQSEPYEQGSDRDQKWYSGEMCMKGGGNKSVSSLTGDDKMVAMFRTWTNICLQAGTADGTTNCYQDDASPSNSNAGTATGCGGSLEGDAKELASKILSCPNIRFQTDAGKAAMEKVKQTGKATECGGPDMGTTILKYILMGASKYKLTVGVLVDGHGCDGGQHDKGNAVDINGVRPADQDFEQRLDWTADDQKNVAEFEKFMDGQVSKGALGFGQVSCFNSTSAPSLTNAVTFDDTCNHLHMDTRGHH